MHIAAQYGATEAAHYLVFLGATLKGPMPAATVARNNQHDDLAAYLENIAPLTQNLIRCCKTVKSDYCQVTLLLKKLAELKTQKLLEGKRISRKDRNNYLFIAHEEVNTAIYQKLVLDELILKKQIHESERALSDLIKPIKDLVTQHAELDAPEKMLRANTPLHLLTRTFLDASTCKEPLKGLIHWIIDTGHANINAMDLEGNTALSLACAHGNRVFAAFLFGHGADPSIGKNFVIIALEHATQNAILPIFFNIVWALQATPKQIDEYRAAKDKAVSQISAHLLST